MNAILELVIAENAGRHLNPHPMNRLVAVDDRLVKFLKKSGRTLDTVPDLDEDVEISQVKSVSQGGRNVEVIRETHVSIIELTMKAGAALGVIRAGIDIIDMNLANWNVLPYREQAEQLAITSLEGELARINR
ncbi:hypothetical protein [Natronoglycomyces albus]|uniref:Uncharacterized protein n=1 Tax=Natronoglycomyces albus TaxID=2811108 RepID=A0A895XM20_9ACTN|nr:hypothetical protein [Natronoglycomyces albus]QSB04822.1 hypothetical protein JQS30_13770 [Natronoglycomyces albus]